MGRKDTLLSRYPVFTKMLGLLLLVAILGTSTFAYNGDLVEQECPVDCHCHYFRINWVTDCSESNLTSIPIDELSPNIYVLDMNGNNIVQVGPFPPSIKLRRLQMAHNRLTELKYESFAGLIYLLEADFSSNAISHVDPEAFRDSPGLIFAGASEQSFGRGERSLLKLSHSALPRSELMWHP